MPKFLNITNSHIKVQVDDDIYEKFNKYQFHIHIRYAARSEYRTGKRIYLHKEIMNAGNLKVYFKTDDLMDCRRSNLTLEYKEGRANIESLKEWQYTYSKFLHEITRLINKFDKKTFDCKINSWCCTFNNKKIKEYGHTFNKVDNWKDWATIAINTIYQMGYRYDKDINNRWERWIVNKLKQTDRKAFMGDRIVSKFNRKDFIDLLEKQKYKCALTGKELVPENSSPDHILSLKNGGNHTIENIQIVLKRINAMKGSLNNKEFIELCCLVADFNRSSEGITTNE